MGNRNIKKYERTKKGLSKSIIIASHHLASKEFTKESSAEFLKSECKMILRKHGKKYFIPAALAIINKTKEVKCINMEIKGVEQKVKLIYEPIEDFLNKLREDINAKKNI